MNPTPQERPFTAEDQQAQDQLLIDWIDDKPVLLDFEAGRLSSDAGVLLVGPVDQHRGLTQGYFRDTCNNRPQAKVSSRNWRCKTSI